MFQTTYNNENDRWKVFTHNCLFGVFFSFSVSFQKKAQQAFEAQKQAEELTQAEAEELAIRKRRAEGTPCTKENFLSWKAKFEAEMAETRKEQEETLAVERKKKKEKVVDKSGRVTGFLQFSGKAGAMNLQAMEEACENAQIDEDSDEDLDVDEDLFDVDDEDLDDLDFDDEDDEEEPDI